MKIETKTIGRERYLKLSIFKQLYNILKYRISEKLSRNIWIQNFDSKVINT